MEKTPLQSKKFTAYLLAQLCLTSCLLLAIKTGGGEMVPVQLALVIVQGFLQVSMILGQAYVDKYVRVAQIVAGKQPFEGP